MSKNGKYEFEYVKNIDSIINKGFELLIAFPDKEKKYENVKMFPVFSSRLPDPKRKDIKEILARYEMTEFDAYEYLKRSGARLPIDSFEFISPIFDEENDEIDRTFFVAGTGFYLPCHGKEEACRKNVAVEPNEKLRFQAEPDNANDKNAVIIFDMQANKLGYVPAYYAESVCKLLQQGRRYACEVLSVNNEGQCAECIKVKMIFYK